MAATKKTTTKNVSRKPKATPAKKRTATTASRTKNTATKKTTAKSKATPELQSFRRSRETEDFMALKLSIQTLYWVILSAAIIGLALWVMTLHNRIQSIYDEIDRAQIVQQELDARELQILRERAENQSDN